MSSHTPPVAMSHPPQQPQPTLPPRQMSPPQASPTLSNGSTSFGGPANKRLKMSPGASPSYTPYATSPRPSATSPAAMTPSATSPVPQSTMSPGFQMPQGPYMPPPQQNGALTMPSAPTPPAASPQPSTPNATQAPLSYSQATLAPIGPSSATPAVGNMGPPTMAPSSFSAHDSRQPSRAAAKANNYEMNDMLCGTGVDLDEEAEIANHMNLESRNGFPNYPRSGRATSHGAGPVSQPPEYTQAETQEQLAAESADDAWSDAARRLAATQQFELKNEFIEAGMIHKRAHGIAHKFGLGLNLDMKPDGKAQYIGKLAPAVGFPQPEIKVWQQKAPDGTMVQTSGSFIPKEAFLVEQILLLSLASKEHLRGLLSDANKIATLRQKSAHGAVPSEWAETAAYPSPKANGIHKEDQRTGAESAVSPRTNPLKRPAEEISNGLPTPVSEAPPPNSMIDTMLRIGKEIQNCEEGRLKKRQKRLEKAAEKEKEGADGSRSGSAVPGTPGAVGSEQTETKAPTKKEGKKAAAKAAEASSTTVNTTLNLFAGGSKKKKYSWMTGGVGSGTSTPRPSAAPGTPGGAGVPGGRAARGPLTKAGVTHLGQFREDSEKGKNIQLRDWVTVLEDRGLDLKDLQEAYNKMDKSDTGDKVATQKAL
ncbi:hypothetical protein GGR56DRAFT_26057 [Xylariaceae sp. FL0804]|nr:hypothetical protein GGR56DRAFT_26057 [Xylariaceae sp. FL0804]